MGTSLGDYWPFPARRKRVFATVTILNIARTVSDHDSNAPPGNMRLRTGCLIAGGVIVCLTSLQSLVVLFGFRNAAFEGTERRVVRRPFAFDRYTVSSNVTWSECHSNYRAECARTDLFINAPRLVTPYDARTPRKVKTFSRTFNKREGIEWVTGHDICVGDRYGTFLPDRPYSDLSREKKEALRRLFAGTAATKAIFDVPPASVESVPYLFGSTWLVNCGWRWSSPHPNHFLIGMGTILSHLLASDDVPQNIVMQTCPNPFQIDFYRVFTSIVADLLSEKVNIIVLQFNWKGLSKVVCMESALFHPADYKTPLGTMSPYVMRKFKEIVARRGLLPSDVVQTTLRERCERREIRIGIFYRSGSSRPRAFLNMNDIVRELETISSNVFLFTTNESLPLRRQIELYNSYDVLISPHSSSNVNALFNIQERTVSVEVVERFYNKHWTWISDRHIISEHHASNCPEKKVTIQCDLVVNVTKLTREIRELEHFLCAASDKDRD